MRELVALIAKLTGFQGRIIRDPSQPNGPPQRDSVPEAPWMPLAFRRRPHSNGLANTVAWYREQVTQR